MAPTLKGDAFRFAPVRPENFRQRWKSGEHLCPMDTFLIFLAFAIS